MAENDTSQGDPQGQQADSAQYQEISPELRQILDAHQLWLNTGGNQGTPANLSKYDFRGLNLSGELLKKANLEEADFQRANLADADLREARLTGANFFEADLTRADFRDADLEKADLADSRGLALLRLARANLADCLLPEDQRNFSGLDYVKDASCITSTLFTTVLISCGYAAVTVFTTSDVALLTNTGTTTLPLLGVGISVFSFYFAAPLLLLAIYIYFHLNLQHLWEVLSTLPAVFPDGQRLDERVYPWLLNWLASSYFPQINKLDEDRRPFLAGLQTYLGAFFAWLLVPLTLLLFWFRYLYVRDLWVTLWHLGLMAAAVWFGFRVCYFAKLTLRWQKVRKPGRRLLHAALTGVVLLLLCLISDGFIFGIPADLEKNLIPRIKWYQQHRSLVPQVLNYKPWHLRIVVNFDEKDVSTKTSKEGQKGDREGAKEIFLARGAPLKGRNLRYARAKGAFMARADLRQAILEGAYLRRADLREAKLGESGTDEDLVILTGAYLFEADLTKACLYRAVLYKASLEGANLEEADLSRAILAEANLSKANLQKAKLGGAILRAADLQEADFRGAKDLEVRNLVEARAWILGRYDDKLLKELGLPADHNNQVEEQKFPKRNLDKMDLRGTHLRRFDFTEASFKETDLRKADLYGTILKGATLTRTKLDGSHMRLTNLQKADLGEATLSNANLLLADFKGANGLKVEQLKAAQNWSLALYDAAMLQRLNLPPDHNDRVLKKQLSNYDLRGVVLAGTFLVKADLQGADLRGADLSHTELRQANLQGADLSGADLTGAYLAEANLKGAKLNGAKLKGASFLEADLEGADLTGAQDFPYEQLEGAKTDSQTRWP